MSQPVVTLVTNIPPVANADSYTVAENSTNAFAVLVNDQVRNPGGFLTLVSVSATNGVATVNGTNVVFTPALNFLGTLTLITRLLTTSAARTVLIVTMLVTNIPPVANPDNYAVRENSTNSFSPLVNDLVLHARRHAANHRGQSDERHGVVHRNECHVHAGAEFPRHGDHRLHDH